MASHPYDYDFTCLLFHIEFLSHLLQDNTTKSVEKMFLPSNSSLQHLAEKVLWNLEMEDLKICAQHYATILKNFGIEEIREILCTLQAHYVFCMHLWDVIIHI